MGEELRSTTMLSEKISRDIDENLKEIERKKRMKIAKYRDSKHPYVWYLTDFTMVQVEERLEYLERDNKKLRASIKGLEQDRELLSNLNVEWQRLYNDLPPHIKLLQAKKVWEGEE